MEDSEQEPNFMAQGVQNFIQEVQNFGPVWSTPSPPSHMRFQPFKGEGKGGSLGVPVDKTPSLPGKW